MKLFTGLLLLIISFLLTELPVSAQIFGGNQSFGGGGSGAPAGAYTSISVATGGLSSGQITALRATPVQIAAAQASTILCGIGQVCKLNYGGVAFTNAGSGTARYCYGSGSASDDGFTDTGIKSAASLSNNGVYPGAIPSTESTDVRNTAINIKNGGSAEYATGNSSLSYEFVYCNLGHN